MASFAKVALTAGTLALILCSTSCIEWTQNSQGQLQSIGVPGVLIWQSQSLAEQKQLAGEGRLAASPGATLDPDAAKLVSIESDADWLTEVNRWREEAGVGEVGENAALDLACVDHARYLVKNGPTNFRDFEIYEQNIGRAAHAEDPSNR